MKRSNHVFLTTIFLAAVSSYTTRAQDVNNHTAVPSHSDSTDAHHASTAGSGARPHHFWFFGKHNKSLSGAQTYGPRTSGSGNGFGNTLRTSSTGHS